MHDKPLAVAYIDDRGLRLTGNRSKSNWHEIADALLPWEARPMALPRWLGWLVKQCTSWRQYVREGGLWPSLPWKKRGPCCRKCRRVRNDSTRSLRHSGNIWTT